MLVSLAQLRRRTMLRWCRTRDDEDGATAVEFALVAPILITLVLGIFEVVWVLVTQSLIEGALRDAARFGITGSSQGGLTRQQYIEQLIDDRTLNFVDMSTVQITTKTYESFEVVELPEPVIPDIDGDGVYDPGDGDGFDDINGNGTWDQDQGVPGVGDSGEIVMYRVNYDLPLLTNYFVNTFGSGGYHPLTASIVVRNEPFNTGGTP